MTGPEPTGLHLSLFGQPRLAFNGRSVLLKAPPRTLPLLASMVLDPWTEPLALSRRRAAAALWPEDDAETARKNLRRHLSYLRKALTDAGVDATGLGIRAIDGVVSWSDVAAFRALAAVPQSAAAAADLYVAPLLAAYADDEWIEPHRLAFAREHSDLVLRLVEGDWRSGHPAAAFARLETALGIVPASEEFVRAALRLSLEIENGDAGLSLYDRLVRRLREDDLEPARETAQLADRLRNPSPRVAVPGHPDPFIGRVDEIRQLADDLGRRRCLVLSGPPGVGKSRLAAEIATRVAERFVDGVWWIDTEGAEDGALEMRALRALRTPAKRDTTLVERLRDRSALLIFDACEADAAQCEALIRSVLAGTSGVRVIATSTNRLRLAGAPVWNVEPLRSSDALALFSARVSEVAPARQLDASERTLASEICAALDNMPLTIEFAARRTRLRSLSAIRDEVRRSPGTALTGSIARAIAPLSAQTLDAFSTLAAFKGDFRLETAAGICHVDAGRMSDVLDELTGASLVNVVTFEDEPRFEILATLRAFGLERLDETRRRSIEASHARYFLDRVVQLDAALRGARAFEAYPQIEPEYDDILSALERALEDPAESQEAARTCLALSRFWYDRGHLADGVACTRRALAVVESEHPLLRAELKYILAWLQRNAGDYRASYAESQDALESLTIAGATRHRVATCELLVANAARMTGDYREALERALSGLRAFEERGEVYWAGYAHLLCGIVGLSSGDVDLAHAHLVEALAAYETVGARADAALVVLNLADCALAKRELELAEILARESAQRCIEVGNLYFLAYANHALVRVLTARDDPAGAVRLVMTVARSAREYDDRELLALCAETAAELSHVAGRPTTAAILSGAADAERRRCSVPRAAIFVADFERLRNALSRRLGDDAARHATEIGAALGSRDLSARIEAALGEANRHFAAPGPARRMKSIREG